MIRTFVLAVSTMYLAVSPTCVNAEALELKRSSLRVLKSGITVVKPPPPSTAYYGPAPRPPVVHYAPPPPPRKLVEAKVLTGKATFLAQNGPAIVGGVAKVTEGISSEVKAAIALIEEAKFKLEYGHKDYSCDLLELSESLIEAAGEQISIFPSPILPVGLEKLKAAIAKVEAHIKWSSSQYGYGYEPKKSVKDALDALNLAVTTFEDTIESAGPVIEMAKDAMTKLEEADSSVNEALKYCGDDDKHHGDYYKDQYGLIAYFEKALMAALDAAKAADEAVDAFNTGFAEVVTKEQLSVEAAENALEAIMDVVAYKKQGYH